jgi:hypothetical protein
MGADGADVEDAAVDAEECHEILALIVLDATWRINP